MIHRVTLVAGAFVATAIMSFAAGSQSVPAPAATPEPVIAADVVAAAPVVAPVATEAPPAPQTVTDTVYVLPTPEPAVVHVTRHAPPTIVKTKRSTNGPTATAAPRHRSSDDERDDERDGEGEHESEGEGD